MELSDEYENDEHYYDLDYYDVDNGYEEDIKEDDKGELFLIIANS